MNYDSNIKRVSFDSEFLTKTPISVVPNKKVFQSWAMEQKSWLKIVDTTIKNHQDEPVSTNIFGRFFSTDSNFSGKVKSIDFSRFNFDMFDLGQYRGRSGTIQGLMNRMDSAFNDKEVQPVTALPPKIKERALELIKLKECSVLKDKIVRFCEASCFEDFQDMVPADMTTSAGPRFYKKNNAGDMFANVTVSKQAVLDSVNGPKVISDINGLMKACSSRQSGEINKFYAANKSMFSIALRGKEEIVNVDYAIEPEKCRPYWAVDITHVLTMSTFFDLVHEMILPFWEDNESISALGFSWFYESKHSSNGVSKIIQFARSVPKGQTRSFGYGDDCYFVRHTLDGKVEVAGPDVAHLDMSIDKPHFGLMEEFLVKAFTNYYPDFKKTWAYGYLKLYLHLALSGFLLVLPHGLVGQKTRGLPSGIPGTTILDLIAMSSFHAAVRAQPWDQDGNLFQVAAKQVGFRVKEETCPVECVGKHLDCFKDGSETVFLGSKIVPYKYPGVNYPLLIPVGELKTYIKSALFPKHANPKSTGETAAWHILRLYGIAISGGLFYHEFSTPAMGAVEAHAKTLDKSGEGEVIVTEDVLEPFTVSGVSYVSQLVGKRYKDITLPRVYTLLSYYYPEIMKRVVKTVDPVFKGEVKMDVKEAGDGVYLEFDFGESPVRDEKEEEKDELAPDPDVDEVIEITSEHIVVEEEDLELVVEEFVQPKVEPEKKKNPIVGTKRKGKPKDYHLDNMVLKFLEKHKKQHDNYLRLVKLQSVISEGLEDPEDYDLFEPIVKVFEDIMDKFTSMVQRKYQEDLDKNARLLKEKKVNELMEQLIRISQNLSWGDSDPPVFPLTTGTVLEKPLDLKVPKKDLGPLPSPPEKKEEKKVTQKPGSDFSRFLNNLRANDWFNVKKMCFIKRQLTNLEQKHVDKLKKDGDKAAVEAYFVSMIVAKWGEEFKKLGPQKFLAMVNSERTKMVQQGAG
jgi:hypothetical protein